MITLFKWILNTYFKVKFKIVVRRNLLELKKTKLKNSRYDYADMVHSLNDSKFKKKE